MPGLRRMIVDRMQASTAIPQFTIADEIDITDLLALRADLNTTHPDKGRFTILSFLIPTIGIAVADHPQINAHLIDEAATLVEHRAVPCGIATQTNQGLMVPVLRDVQAQDLWPIAQRIVRLFKACRAGAASRADLGGSKITELSLGALAGLGWPTLCPAPNHSDPKSDQMVML